MTNQDSGDTAAPPDQHIIFQNGTWAIVPEGSENPIRTFDSRDEALQWAARSLNHQGANLIVYNEDGSVNDTIRPEA